MNQTNADGGAPAMAEITAAYELPAHGTYADWKRRELRDFVPDTRQALVVEAVREALAAGMYYTSDVFAFCAKLLGVTAEQAQVQAKKVENGEVGMDVYYARDYLRARERFAAEDANLAKLKPHVGQSLGTLMFNDYKRNTGCTVTAVSDDGRGITVEAKRGKVTVQFDCDASQIAKAMDRAAEQGLRKGNFAATVGGAPNE